MIKYVAINILLLLVNLNSSKSTTANKTNFALERQKKTQYYKQLVKKHDDLHLYKPWGNFEWSEDQKKEIRERIAYHLRSKISSSETKIIERNSVNSWNTFYINHKGRFFKNRNWLASRYVEFNQSKVIFEIGCGVGNTIFPILKINPDPDLHVYCCDFSTFAIDVLKQNPAFELRCTPFVCDLTQSDWNEPFEHNFIDVGVMLFVLSSIPPNKMEFVLKKFYEYLKPGGTVIFRDYGQYDISQLRFRDGNCIAKNYYVRGEKTLAYFFTLEEISDLFRKCGYEVLEKRYDQKLQINRKRKLKMYRVWIEMKLRKPL